MKRALILGVLCTLINFSSITEANSIRHLAETTSIRTSDSTGNEGAETNPPNSNGDFNQVESANPEVELDGAIGPWAPNDGDMPNFDGIAADDIIGTKPNDDKLFKISVTVPLNMNFVIVNENDNGSSPFGKFVSPYHSITNNGTYPLNVSLNSFTRADESSNSGGTARTNSSSKDTKLYVEEPESGNNKVQMRLNLNYDRPEQGTYLKTIGLHNLSEATDKTLGEIGSNETARIYYRSDLWETPKSEGIETDVVSNFNLILSFSTQNTNSGTGGTESGDGSSAGSDGSGENTGAQEPSGS